MIHKRLSHNVEFSFGKGVGSKIYDAIDKANHSVFVLTPYITEGYIDFLLRKKEEGINVYLATTTDAQKGRMHDIYKKIIVQNRITNEKMLAFKNKVKQCCLLLGFSALMAGLAILFWHVYHHNTRSIFRELKRFWHDDSAQILTTFSILFCSYLLHKIIYRIKVFSYIYSTKLHFMVVPSLYSNDSLYMTSELDSFVHSKIYVIDNKDIFIGSVNLTMAGLKHNIETFVKISDHEAVEEIMFEVAKYLSTQCRPVDIGYLGSCLYPEPFY